jgi:hypothetical protein
MKNGLTKVNDRWWIYKRDHLLTFGASPWIAQQRWAQAFMIGKHMTPSDNQDMGDVYAAEAAAEAMTRGIQHES